MTTHVCLTYNIPRARGGTTSRIDPINLLPGIQLHTRKCVLDCSTEDIWHLSLATFDRCIYSSRQQSVSHGPKNTSQNHGHKIPQ